MRSPASSSERMITVGVGAESDTAYSSLLVSCWALVCMSIF